MVLHQCGHVEALTAHPMPLLNYIDGKFVPAASGETRPFHNPADNSIIGEAPESSAVDAQRAIEAARKAFDEGPWPQSPAGARAEKLFKLADLIESRAEEFAQMDTRNNGKPLREAAAVALIAVAVTTTWSPLLLFASGVLLFDALLGRLDGAAKMRA